MYSKTDMNAPAHHTMRLDITGYDKWDCRPTKLYVRVTCWDAAGSLVHTLLATTIRYANVPLALALCRDLKNFVHILQSKKLSSLPQKVEIIIHDYLSFLLLSKQVQVPTDALQAHLLLASRKLKAAEIPYEIKLGTPDLKEEFAQLVEQPIADLTPTDEGSGRGWKLWAKQQRRLRLGTR